MCVCVCVCVCITFSGYTSVRTLTHTSEINERLRRCVVCVTVNVCVCVRSVRQMVKYESRLGGTTPAGTPWVCLLLPSTLQPPHPQSSNPSSLSPLFPLFLHLSRVYVCVCACWAGGAGRLVTHDRGGPELGMCLQGGSGADGRWEIRGRGGRDTVFTVCPAET